MTDPQSEGLGTARALFDAGNTEGAKRILGQLLEKNPDDFFAANLMVDTLQKQDAHEEAIAFCDNWLSKHPNATPMHVNRFMSLSRLGRKAEMQKSLKKFRENFPHDTQSINTMELVLNARSGKVHSARKQLQDALGGWQTPSVIRTKGMGLHNLNDFFEADHNLTQALEHYPNDAELLAAMATNRFQMGRLASARVFAARCLAADPTKRRMAFLSRATWLFYYPSCYIFLIAISLYMFLASRLNRILAFGIFLVVLLQILDAMSLFNYPLKILLGSRLLYFDAVVFLICTVAYYIVVSDQHFNRLFGRKKSVKLKKY